MKDEIWNWNQTTGIIHLRNENWNMKPELCNMNLFLASLFFRLSSSVLLISSFFFLLSCFFFLISSFLFLVSCFLILLSSFFFRLSSFFFLPRELSPYQFKTMFIQFGSNLLETICLRFLYIGPCRGLCPFKSMTTNCQNGREMVHPSFATPAPKITKELIATHFTSSAGQHLKVCTVRHGKPNYIYAYRLEEIHTN